ncbi:serine-type endopeptidase activity [Nesidiocoris tenuis]|uniref:Serine-type endopeptidase activity n=1 Tax=Nesidiocoris tenuis TaxID=355587 RepID=A0ABN7A9U3_9HEMI|nr:serine-type endopeptidase activity [Nesidiocoris tenuis]
MARWITLLATCALAAVVYAEVIEKENGYLTQRVSSSAPWTREPETRAAGVDSSEHGVAPGPKTTSCKCGWANRDGSRIVGGTTYAPNEYPFIVGVARTGWGGFGYSPFCGGSIITPNHVITAAHCTDDIIKQRTPIVALLGTHDRSKPNANSVAVPVSQINQHAAYNPQTILNDISILTLQQSIAYNAIIGPVCLPQPGLDVTSRTVRIIGWGAEKFQGQMTTKPKKLDTTVVAPATCSRAWGGMVSGTRPTQVCTHSQRETACQGDSGGPVVWLDPQTNRYTLIGLVSFGPQCNDDRPTVHTRVEAYLPWIQQQIAATKPGATCQKL